MSDGPTIHAEWRNLGQVVRDVRKLEHSYIREINRRWKDAVAQPVSSDVQAKIEEERLYESGHLHDSIRFSVRGGVGYVRSAPPLKPGPKSPRGYAPIYEYGHGGARAFMRPVIKEWFDSGKAQSAMEPILAWAEREWESKV